MRRFRFMWTRRDRRIASDNAQHVAGTSQDDGTPAENPSDASLATVHLGRAFGAAFFLTADSR